MAVTIYHYSVNGGETPDGSAAEPYPLIESGAWHTSITGFNFNGNSLFCKVFPGTYTIPVMLDSADFTVAAPQKAGFLMFHAAQDGTSNLWVPPNPNWSSAEPDWDDTNMPVFHTDTNIATIDQFHSGCRGIKFTTDSATGRFNYMVANMYFMDWCIVENSRSSTASAAMFNTDTVLNSVFRITSAQWNYIISKGFGTLNNCRVEGPSNRGTGGNRDGIIMASTITNPISRCTILHCNRYAIFGSSTSTSNSIRTTVDRVTIYDCLTGFYVRANNALALQSLSNSLLTDLTLGVNRDTTNVPATISVNNAFYNVATIHGGNLGSHGNFGESGLIAASETSYNLDNLFVDKDNGDLRINNTHELWGTGIGAADEQDPQYYTGFMRGGFIN